MTAAVRDYPTTPDDLPLDCELSRLRANVERFRAPFTFMQATRARWKMRVGECERAIRDADPDNADFTWLAGLRMESDILIRKLNDTEDQIRALGDNARWHEEEWTKAWNHYRQLVRKVNQGGDWLVSIGEQPVKIADLVDEIEAML